MPRLLIPFLICACAYAHVVSMSSGELHVEGRTATYELRIPVYELTHVTHPETTLLDQIQFEGARRTSSTCQEQKETYICRADYEFDRPVPDKIEVECTLFQVTVPNHVHLLYAVQGPNSDQEVFDQSVRQAEVRFHPPSRAEVIAKAAAAGIAGLFKSVSGLLFLAVLAMSGNGNPDDRIPGRGISRATDFTAHSDVLKSGVPGSPAGVDGGLSRRGNCVSAR
jgi:hypothetical protein